MCSPAYFWKINNMMLVKSKTSKQDSQTDKENTSKNTNASAVRRNLRTCKPVVPKYGDTKSITESRSDVTAKGAKAMSAFYKTKYVQT